MAQESAEVVIVGGGALGASAAFHLAAMGITDVVLIERDTIGSGSTSKAAGGIRTQFADELNIRIALRSLAEFESFEERVGVDIGFRQHGYLFLLDSIDDVRLFRAALALQGSLGVISTELTLDEVLTLVPPLQVEGLLGATYCPRDGIATPETVAQGYAQAASSRGVRIRQGCSLERIGALGKKVHSVETTDGRIKTDTVICTAGVWSKDVAALAGIELPVSGEARWMHFSPENGGLPDALPLTIDFSTGFYFHREGAGLAFGGREPTIEGVATHATRRLPLLEQLPIQASWWGYYEMSPDHNAIVGEVSEPSRFLYATGFSGHGFQQCPAVGEHLAELVTGRPPTLDLSAFSLDRFAHGQPREEQIVI
jgi:sarcosine oxidase subunit beta